MFKQNLALSLGILRFDACLGQIPPSLGAKGCTDEYREGLIIQLEFKYYPTEIRACRASG